VAWPTDGKAGMKVSMLIDAVWTDVTAYVRHDSGIDITRSIPSGAPRSDPGSMRVTLGNPAGRFDPRNPTGPYYGLIGRGTQVKYELSEAPPWAHVGTAELISTPDAAGIELATDRDVRIEFSPDDAEFGETGALCGKWAAVPHRSWHLSLQGGIPRFTWSTDGTVSAYVQGQARVRLITDRPVCVRAVVDADDGAGIGWVTFYEGASVGSTKWVQLGDPVAHTTTIGSYAAGTADLWIGDGPDVTGTVPAKVHAFELRDAAASLVADVDFGLAVSGDTEVVDGEGLTWTATTAYTDLRPRFYGEVASWPVAFTKAGEDSWCPLEVSGPLRRIVQAPDTARSPMWRHLSSRDGLRAYWPMEDPVDGAEFPEVAGRPSMCASPDVTITTTEPFRCSGALTLIGTSRLNGLVEPYTATSYIAVICLVSFPAAGETVNSEFFSLYTTGTAKRWQIEYDSGGAFQVYGFNTTASGGTGEAAPAPIYSSASWDLGILNSPRLMMFEIMESGADILVGLRSMIVGQSDWAWDWSDSLPGGHTVGAATEVEVNTARFIDQTYVGHFAVYSDEGTLYSDMADPLNCWRGETAVRRAYRVGYENDLNIWPMGDVDDSQEMGYQPIASTLEVLDECATTDGGTITEDRASLDLFCRPGRTVASTWPVATVPWALVFDAASADDDRDTANQVSTESPMGWTWHADDAASIAQVGLYQESATVNPRYAGQVKDAAGWLLHLGTSPARRWPSVTFELSRDTTYLSDALAIDLRDRLVLTSTPDHVGHDDISLLVTGYREFTNGYVYQLSVDAGPGESMDVGRYGVARYGTTGSTLAAGVDSDDVALSVTALDLWTLDVTQCPFDVVVGGEVMTVTAVAGAASPQTLTVTRSVNGVVKAHAAGAVVALAEPAYYGM
jgi:hypothetical protein